MAKLEIKLTQEQHAALDESLKPFYVATQDGGFELEGIGSIQRALIEEKAKKATKPELLTELEQLREFKSQQDAKAAEADDAKLKEEKKFTELEEKLRTKITELEGKVAETENSWRGEFLQERTKNMLAEKGVRPEMTKYALLDVQNEFDLDDAKQLKLKDGIGDVKEIDGVIAKLRESTPDFFKATTQLGGGASGSGNNNGGGKTIARADYDANPAAYASQLAKGEAVIADQ